MKFLVIFLALAVVWYFPKLIRSTHSRAVQYWVNLWHKLGLFQRLPAAVQYTLIVLMPTIAIFAALYSLETVFWGLPNFALEVLLVLYVLLHADIQRHVDNYQEKVVSGDFQAAFLCAQQHLGLECLEGEFDSAEQIAPLVTKSLLYRWFQYFFLALFWYVIADVGGILLLWLSLQYAQQFKNPAAQKVLGWLEAIPVRLLALTYGLAGNLTRALPIWRKYLTQWQTNHADLLFSVAQSALYEVPSSAEITPEWHRLHRYSVSIWLVIIAIATLGGWVL